MRDYVFTAAADGTPNKIKATGQYMRYYVATSGADNPEIRVVTDRGDEVRLKPGQGRGLNRECQSFDVINHEGVAAIVGVLSIGGAGEFVEDDRITGEVSVIDGGKSRTLADAAFLSNIAVGQVAAQYAHAQLWNPAASGKRLVVEAITAGSSGADSIQLRYNASALASAFSVLNPASKLIDAAVATSAAEQRYENNVALLGTSLFSNYSPIGVGWSWAFREPVVLQPGTGLILNSTVVNTNIVGNFEFFEEDDA